jgi:hypothetical protein
VDQEDGLTGAGAPVADVVAVDGDVPEDQVVGHDLTLAPPAPVP